MDVAMSEAAHTATASQLRHRFAAILSHSAPSDPERLQRTHELAFCGDYLNADRRVRSTAEKYLLSVCPQNIVMQCSNSTRRETLKERTCMQIAGA